jgi:AcrR family transcriptional regulator
MPRRTRRNINHARRAEIGAERRSRTQTELLAAALELFGHPHGRNTRIEDVCAKAHVARGTFYNYFPGIESLLESLSDALTQDFDAAVHATFAHLSGPVERTCAAMRYYLHAALVDPRWGWAIVNSSVGRTLYGENITRHVRESIQEGIDSGDFTIDSADVGRDILLGTGISATISLLQGGTPQDYPEKVAFHVLLSLGAARNLATKVTSRPLQEFPRLTTNSLFFRGTLGGTDVTTVQSAVLSSLTSEQRHTGRKTRTTNAASGGRAVSTRRSR